MGKKKETKEVLDKNDEGLQKIPMALLSVVDDLNAEKAKLEESKARDEAILLSIGDGLVVTDKNGKIVLLNKSAKAIMGWEKKQVMEKLWVNLTPMEDNKGNIISLDKRPINLALTSGISTVNDDYFYVKKDKIKFPVAITVTPVIIKGKAIGIVEVFRDVTHEKEIERAKTEFISLAAHQLRTPLSSIKWVLELFMQDKDLKEKQKERLNDLYISNQRLIGLVNDLLNVARIEAGKLIAKKKITNIAEIINASFKSCRPNAEKKKQKINVVIEREIKEAMLDPMLFSESLSIILSNAINYAPENSNIDVAVSSKGGNYLIAIHNTGAPIPESSRKKLFEKFYRGVDSQNVKAEGSGLGLFIAKGMIEANGGTIWFKSSANEGTTFYFTIPIK